jgi:hypothetical protein
MCCRRDTEARGLQKLWLCGMLTNPAATSAGFRMPTTAASPTSYVHKECYAAGDSLEISRVATMEVTKRECTVLTPKFAYGLRVSYSFIRSYVCKSPCVLAC